MPAHACFEGSGDAYSTPIRAISDRTVRNIIAMLRHLRIARRL